MNSFFSFHILKFNALMSLGTLAIIASSFPAKAVAEEACVRASGGSVVCGILVPKPGARQEPSESNETIQTTVDEGNVTWDLKSCSRKNSSINCVFSLSSSVDRGYGVFPDGSKIVDSEGNEYLSKLTQNGKRSTVQSYYYFRRGSALNL
jgi:hypothetical protein